MFSLLFFYLLTFYPFIELLPFPPFIPFFFPKDVRLTPHSSPIPSDLVQSYMINY